MNIRIHNWLQFTGIIIGTFALVRVLAVNVWASR